MHLLRLRWTVLLPMLVGLPAAAAAQTDYYNLDAGRPVRIEDAYATERYAFELKLASARLERTGAGLYAAAFEPEIAYGVFPRTHVEIGLPLTVSEVAGSTPQGGVAGLEASVLHNLNTETRALPAFGLRGDVLLPVGKYAPDRAHASLTALVTRTWKFARVHLNGRYTFGDDPAGLGTGEVERWLAGVAVDRALPLRSMLLVADFYGRRPLGPGAEIEWHADAGIRYQLSPRLAFDAGVGRRFNGDPAWALTFGTAYAFAIQGLMR